MRTFTVVLSLGTHPDPSLDIVETWVGWVEAESPEIAVTHARRECAIDDSDLPPEELQVVAVFEGHHDNLV